MIELFERSLQCHVMHFANLEPVDVAAHFSGVLVLRGRTGLEGIVVSNEDVLGLYLSAMDLQHVVFHDVHVVVKLVGWKLAADLSELRRDLRVAVGSQFGRRSVLAARDRREGAEDDQQGARPFHRFGSRLAEVQ